MRTDEAKRRFFDLPDRTIVRSSRFRNDDFHFVDHMREFPDMRGKLAIDMAVRWGMVAGNTNSEDSKGRAKIDLMPVDEVVTRAVETADLLMTEIERRGWMIKAPSVTDYYSEEGEED